MGIIVIIIIIQIIEFFWKLAILHVRFITKWKLKNLKRVYKFIMES